MTDGESGTQVTRKKFLAGAAAAGLGLAAAGGGGTAIASQRTPVEVARAQKPVRGGRLRVGLSGGSSADTLAADNSSTLADEARAAQLYQGLTARRPNFSREMWLAEEIEVSHDARTYTIRVRPDVEFHNGKTLGAEDVAFTLKTILNPKNPLPVSTFLIGVDTKAFKILDRRTLRIKLTSANATLLDVFAEDDAGIMPVGYNPKKGLPIGTGPFKVKSFTPGVSTVMERFKNYWQPGLPYLDELVMYDFADDSARVNALLGNQIDVMASVPLGDLTALRTNPSVKLLQSRSGNWLPFYMRVDVAPFDDVRVRQAFRLIANRPQLVEQAFGGHGSVANDMYGQYDPCYPSSFPQRVQDIDQAKSLLRQAGHSGLSVVLNCTSDVPGMLSAAQVYAQQAAAAGVKVKVNNINPSEYYTPVGPGPSDYAFGMDFWSTRPYLTQAEYSSVPGSSLNEVHWKDARWYAYFRKAVRTVDDKERCLLIRECERIEYETGGYIIWGDQDLIDAYRTNVHGLVPSVYRPLGNYDLAGVWLS